MRQYSGKRDAFIERRRRQFVSLSHVIKGAREEGILIC
jgi:hypothetical protein